MQIHTSSSNTMRRMAWVLSIALASATAAFPAAAQSASAMAGHGAMGTPAKHDGAMAPSAMHDEAMAMHKSMDDMHAKMRDMKPSGDVDRDFVMMMRAHHQGAVEMAQRELDSGKDRAVIKTARKIITAQKREIAEFDAWLAQHPMNK